MRTVTAGVLIVLVGAAVVGLLAAPAMAGQVTCPPNIVAATNHNIVVPAGQTCVIDANVNGNVRVGANASTVTGNVQFNGPTLVTGGSASFNIDGNAECMENVTDSYAGSVNTDGNEQRCPPGF